MTTTQANTGEAGHLDRLRLALQRTAAFKELADGLGDDVGQRAVLGCCDALKFVALGFRYPGGNVLVPFFVFRLPLGHGRKGTRNGGHVPSAILCTLVDMVYLHLYHVKNLPGGA
jgi:hypothetical protein